MNGSQKLIRGALAVLPVALIVGVGATALAMPAQPLTATPQSVECDPDNGGLSLPDGFCALVVSDELGAARHLEVAANGDIFVAIPNRRISRTESETGGIAVLRDTDGDGRSDVIERWGDNGGNEVLLQDGYLYFAPDDAVLRYPLANGAMRPAGGPDTIVSELPATLNHRAKSLAIDEDGNLFVNIGSPTNSCQIQDRSVESAGRDPCEDLETRAGVWRFDANRLGQTQADGTRFGTGMRNTVALRLSPLDGHLYGAVHGRDQLAANWPSLYTNEESAEKPAEEFVRITEGSNFGWPYCLYDREIEKKVLNPEYGGDRTTVGRCADMDDPLVAFPGHWAPNDIEFSTGDQFPEQYRGGAFIAFHGSWNRAPLPQGGYRIVYVEFEDGEPTGEWDTFADGFAGADVSPRGAEHRPVGLAMGPDGSLYVSDSRQGTLWRIVYTGE